MIHLINWMRCLFLRPSPLSLLCFGLYGRQTGGKRYGQVWAPPLTIRHIRISCNIQPKNWIHEQRTTGANLTFYYAAEKECLEWWTGLRDVLCTIELCALGDDFAATKKQSLFSSGPAYRFRFNTASSFLVGSICFLFLHSRYCRRLCNSFVHHFSFKFLSLRTSVAASMHHSVN